MDSLFNNLYSIYQNTLNDILIGYPISNENLAEMWNIIHNRHYVKFENDAPEIFNILEYYEYK